MMAENFGNSSQENLPLSQETFNSLLNMIDLPGKGEILDGMDTGVLVQPHGVHVPSRSTLPATCNWRGNYEFELLFGHQEKFNKHITWTYSHADNKLYIQKDAVCPFSFRTNMVMSGDVFLRAMAVFTSPEYASEVVTRCVNHSQQESVKGIFEAEHIIRSDSPLACYEIDVETKRHSVILPFENPPVGQDFSTYTLKFACFNSCAGGPNRRPLTLVFTLEQGQNVLGRVSLDLKICACPGRDRDIAEKERLPRPMVSAPPPKKMKTEPSSISNPQDIFKNFPKKKKMDEKLGKEEEFVIRVKGRECYNFLTGMKKLFQTHKRYNRLSPECKAILHIYRTSSDEDEKS